MTMGVAGGAWIGPTFNGFSKIVQLTFGKRQAKPQEPQLKENQPNAQHSNASDWVGERVDVYYNLNKGCLSLRALDGPQRGRVVAHADSVMIQDAEFVVQPGGRQRVLREKRKNVHAFVRGVLQAVNSLLKLHPATARPVTYNPYLYDSFVTRDTKEPVVSAPKVLIEGKSVTAQAPVLQDMSESKQATG